MIDMDTSIENCDNVFSNLADGIRATVELVIEEWVHGFDTVLEGSLDRLDALFNALSFAWNITQGSQNLSRHGEVVDRGAVRLAALSVMLLDQWLDELEELLKIFLELHEFRTHWFLNRLFRSYLWGFSYCPCIEKMII